MGTMARQSEIVSIVELTPDEVVAKVNAATSQIIRDDAIDAQCVSGWDNVIIEIRDAWKGKPINQRGVIFTEPPVGGFRVVSIQKKDDGDYEFDYDDDPVT